MPTLAHYAHFVIGLGAPIAVEKIRKTKNGLYYGCYGILAFVIGKELIYDVFIKKQSLFADPQDSVFYLLGAIAAIIVVLAHRKHKSIKNAKKGKK